MTGIFNNIKGIILLYSGSYDFDNEINPFQVNNNFYYLTKLDIPNFAFLYNTETKQKKFFFKYKDSTWFPNDIFLESIDSKVLNINDIHTHLDGVNQIYTLNNITELNINTKIIKDVKLIDSLCNTKRIIKTKDEIKNIRQACYISSSAIISIMNNISNFTNERDIVSYFKMSILSQNVEKLAYLPICSNGENNSVLHYVWNQNRLLKSNMLLLDIGCKYNNYCSDITRSFPISGKFTVDQKSIYNIVFECQKYAIQELKSGLNWLELERNVFEKMYKLLLELKIVLHTKSTEHKIQLMKLFMPHGLGHTVGLDVHDTNPEGGLTILKENMIVTIEPGIYFIDKLLKNNNLINFNKLNKYKKISGIRIEDTILITKNSYEVLSSQIPKEINEIELLCQK